MPPIFQQEPMLPHVDWNEVLTRLREFHKAMHDSATSYTRIVFGFGYAGYFALWSGTKTYLGRHEAIGSALLMMVSVTVYLLFEVGQAAVLSVTSIKLGNACHSTQAQVVKGLREFEDSTARFRRWQGWAWWIAFPLCVITGFGAGVFLATAFARDLLK